MDLLDLVSPLDPVDPVDPVDPANPVDLLESELAMKPDDIFREDVNGALKAIATEGPLKPLGYSDDSCGIYSEVGDFFLP